MIDLSFFSRIVNKFCSKTGAYVFYVISALAFAFLSSATWTYSFIADLYPLGAKFVPTVLIACVLSMAAAVSYILALTFDKGKHDKFFPIFNIIYMIFAVLSVILFIYTAVLVFSMDKGLSAENFKKGFEAIAGKLPWVGLAAALPLGLFFASEPKKAAKAIIAAVLIIALVAVPTIFVSNSADKWDGDSLPAITLKSENLLEGGSILYESLKEGEKADAKNLLEEGNACWTPQDPNRSPAEGSEDANNSYVEIKLKETSTFNTAIIEETGNQVQYFRLQAEVNGEWITIYESEKIQTSRLCSFDSVTTDKIRLSIDQFRSSETPAKIRSIRLYNEPKINVDDFEVTAYQRLDGDAPTEILAKGEEYVNNYARYYDVYSTIIVFAAVHWNENGQMGFGEGGEEKFAQELNALKEIISHRSNKDHQVKVIVTALADGTWGEGHNGVNGYMAQYWESVADQIIAFADKYDLDGVDIDWEYPQNSKDWKLFDNFIARLDDGMQKINPDAILSGALSAGSLGMSEETLKRFDQIQFMAYDGNDMDGYQSSLQQAQEGLQDFIDNGADISKINIGIAAYGRPVNGSPYWASWRTLEEATYWNNKYHTVHDAGQVYEGTFCSPALAGDKTAYALFSGAGGVMVFRVACDKTMDDPNSVAVGIENALKRYTVNW